MTCSKIKLTCFLVGCGGCAQTSTLNKDNLKLRHSPDTSLEPSALCRVKAGETEDRPQRRADCCSHLSQRPVHTGPQVDWDPALASQVLPRWLGETRTRSGREWWDLKEAGSSPQDFNDVWYSSTLLTFKKAPLWSRAICKTKFKMWVPWGWRSILLVCLNGW